MFVPIEHHLAPLFTCPSKQAVTEQDLFNDLTAQPTHVEVNELGTDRRKNDARASLGGASIPDTFRRGATYVHKILHGTKPSDLPVEQQTKFEFIINLTTAKAIGLTT